MFCNQCEETIGNGCDKIGACGKTPDVADKQDELINLLKEISLLSKDDDEKVDKFIVDSLFATITNANFNPEDFDKRLDEAKSFRNNFEGEITPIKDDVDQESLKQILLYGLKGLAAYAHHAYVLGYKDAAIFDFTKEALSATIENKSIDELVGLVLKCGEIGVTTMALLDKANTEKFGNPEVTHVKLGVGSKPGILISGHDLNDMKQLLEQTKDSGVDVYTHSEMLPGQYYPEFKKYENLVGNYGGAWHAQKSEFETFNGPILMTTNCIVPPKDSYKSRLFTTGVAGFSGVKHISEIDGKKDFSEIVELAKTCKAPEEIETGEIVGGFAHVTALNVADKIIDAVKSGAIKRFFVMAGCDGRQKNREYYTDFAKELPKDTVILTAGCAKYRYNKLDLGDIGGIPRVLDAGQCNDSYSLVVIAKALQEAFELDDINKLPISYNIAWYEQKAVLVLLSLLHLGVKDIMLGPKLPAFVSENVLNVLVKNFGVRPNTDVETDLPKLLAGQ
jgi:hydroxylamine reductase